MLSECNFTANRNDTPHCVAKSIKWLLFLINSVQYLRRKEAVFQSSRSMQYLVALHHKEAHSRKPCLYYIESNNACVAYWLRFYLLFFIHLFVHIYIDIPALEVEGRGTVITAQQIPSFTAAITSVVVGGPAAPPNVPHQLPTLLIHLFGLWGSQQCLDLL